MAYEPLNLQNGQTLTAEDLHHIEEGIGGDVLVVTLSHAIDDDANVVADKTYDEIVEAWNSGKAVFMRNHSTDPNSTGGNMVLPLSYISDNAVVFTGMEVGDYIASTGGYVCRGIVYSEQATNKPSSNSNAWFVFNDFSMSAPT